MPRGIRPLIGADSIALWTHTLGCTRDNAVAHNDLGIALCKERRFDEGIFHYRETLRIQPGFAQAHYNLGLALFRQGNTKEAIGEAQKAFDLEPANGTYENNLAWKLATAPEGSLRDGARAVKLAMDASESAGGGNPEFQDTLAAAYAKTGRFPDAVRTARNALEPAESQSNTELASELCHDISLYEAGHRLGQAQ